ncbi:hypothetical protein HRbin16_03314 [bacterium HR16]|nr:hypothetical protein HRbin16_03314 [bacterium HR16]
MPRVRWSDLQARRREQFIAMMERGTLKRLPRTRPRDPEEERVLSLLVRLRWKRWIESGKLVILGPRRWRLQLGETPQSPQNDER